MQIVDAGSANPEFMANLAIILGRMRSGMSNQRLVDAVVQKHHGDYDLYDAWAFGQVYALIVMGSVVTCSVSVGATPSADRDKSGNQAKLNGLPNEFKAHFEGGYGDDDGWLEWKAHIGARQYVAHEPSSPKHEHFKCWLRPETVPLEVGTTAASKTLSHILRQGAVARWPYDSSDIVIFRRIDEGQFEREKIVVDCTSTCRFESVPAIRIGGT